MRPVVTIRPLSGWPVLARVSILERAGIAEITCTPDEVPTITEWARAHVGHTGAIALPVSEYRERRWGRPEYRWTAEADAIYRATTARAA